MSLLDLSKPWERLSPEERSLAKSLGSQLAGHPVTERVGHDLVLADRARQITRCLARESGITAEGGRDLPDAEKRSFIYQC